MRIRFLVPVAALLAAPRLTAAQTVELSRPAAQFAEPFSFIRGVRELRDGRVLVADSIEDRVTLVDLARGTATDVLTEGGGPRSVRLPMHIVPLGDSSVVVDYGNSRVVVLDPEGQPVRASVVERPGRLFVRGLARDGAWLYAVPAWAEGPDALPDDSVRVVRWRQGASSEETVFVMQGNRFRKDRSPAMQPRIPTVGYAGQDAWAVADGGVLWVARLVETTEWATSHPSFDASGVFVAPRDRRWVRRAPEPGRLAIYDEFDAEGRPLREVRMPIGQRVVAVTARGVYAIRENEDGEQFLLRYALP